MQRRKIAAALAAIGVGLAVVGVISRAPESELLMLVGSCCFVFGCAGVLLGRVAT